MPAEKAEKMTEIPRIVVGPVHPKIEARRAMTTINDAPPPIAVAVPRAKDRRKAILVGIRSAKTGECGLFSIPTLFLRH